MGPADRYSCSKTLNGWKVSFDTSICDSSIINQIELFTSTSIPPEGWMRLQSSDYSNVWKFSINNKWYIFKYYLNRNILELVKAAIRGSRAKKASLNGEKLIKESFHTPSLIAYGEKYFVSFTVSSFIVTEFLEYSYGAYTMLKQMFSLPLPAEQIKLKRALIHGMGKYIGLLHFKGILHGDLRLDNILIRDWDSNDAKFYLIDNERNKSFPHGIPDRLREKNLVQINMVVIPQITFTDRLRFFKAYLGENPELRPHAKEWMRKVTIRTKQRLRKKFPSIWESKTTK